MEIHAPCCTVLSLALAAFFSRNVLFLRPLRWCMNPSAVFRPFSRPSFFFVQFVIFCHEISPPLSLEWIFTRGEIRTHHHFSPFDRIRFCRGNWPVHFPFWPHHPPPVLLLSTRLQFPFHRILSGTVLFATAVASASLFFVFFLSESMPHSTPESDYSFSACQGPMVIPLFCFGLLLKYRFGPSKP